MVEAINNQVFNNVENFSIREGFEGGPKKLKIQGLALPFGKVSRNGVLYRKESTIKQAKTLEGKPLLFNHDAERLPIGKVTFIEVKEDGLYYEAEIDENEQEIIQKLKNEYIQNVSIQCMIENPDFKEDGTVIVDVKEFLELSVVTIPGFKEATAKAIEKLKMVEKKEPKKESVRTTTEQDGDNEDYTLEDAKSEIEALKTQNAELNDRISVIESRLDADEEEEESADEEEMDDEEKPEDEEEACDGEEEESDGEDEEDDKPKEKLKRKSVPTGSQKESTAIDMKANRLKNMGY